MIELMQIRNVRRHDLVEVAERDGEAPTFQRVTRVDHEPGHPVAVYFAVSKVVEDAVRMVRVRRFTVLRGGRA